MIRGLGGYILSTYSQTSREACPLRGKLRGLPFRVNAFDVVKFFYEEGNEGQLIISTSGSVPVAEEGQ